MRSELEGPIRLNNEATEAHNLETDHACRRIVCRRWVPFVLVLKDGMECIGMLKMEGLPLHVEVSAVNSGGLAIQ